MLRSKFIISTSRGLVKRVGGIPLGSTISAKQYHHFAVVGSGPSGFYTAKYLLDINESVRVDIFEKLPTPYGLVRSGVAPDHPEVKTVEETFTLVADSPRVRMFCNVLVSDEAANTDVQHNVQQTNVIAIQDLMESYSGVILAHGASSDVALGIPGESLPGVLSSREFVNWYNGHPDFAQLHTGGGGGGGGANEGSAGFDLSKVEHVVVVGQGNVGLDCARVLGKLPADLAETDISTVAHAQLARSSVKTVTIVGRRGHVQSAFTIKELRELTRLRGVRAHISPADLEAGTTAASAQELEGNRPKKRIVELIETIAKASSSASASDPAAASAAPAASTERVIDIKYLLTPLEAVPSTPTDGTAPRVAGLKVVRNSLQGAANQQKAVPIPGESAISVLPCDLLIKSVGYKCTPLGPSIPFNSKTNTVPNVKGKVLTNQSESPSVVPGLYVTGWLKRGATGIIGTNVPDAKETAASVAEDTRSGLLREVDDAVLTAAHPAGREQRGGGEVGGEVVVGGGESELWHPALPWMNSAGGRAMRAPRATAGAASTVVSWPEYKKIQQMETERGLFHTPTKLREKLLTVEEMLQVAKS
jgi:adrenodoxin-NADP+ reductase